MNKQDGRLYGFGPFRLDLTERILCHSGIPVSVPPMAFDTLVVLVERQGHLVLKEELLKILWPDSFVEEGSLTNNISILRKALGEGASEHRYIETVPRRGYRFVATVEELSDEVVVKERTRSSVVIEEEEEISGLTQSTEVAEAAATEKARWQVKKKRPLQIMAACIIAAGLAIMALFFVLANTSLLALLWPGADTDKAGSSLRNASFTRLTDQPFLEYYPSLSPDGRSFAYLSFVIAITQGSQQMFHPELSPDGEWLAFDSTGNNREDLFVIAPDGTGQRQLTEDVHKDRLPRWSPDGKRIAFISDRTGSFEVWTISPDGSGLQQLTFTSGRNVVGSVWSPDGTRLAYSLEGPDTFIIEAGRPWSEQTPQLVPRVSGTKASFRAFSWSPDGRKLAGWYRRSESETENAFGIALYSIESQQFEKFDAFGITPVWQSDGRRLIFGDGGGALYLLDTQTKKVRQLYSLAPQLIDGFTLSQDDRLIYFSYFTEEADIWLLSRP